MTTVMKADAEYIAIAIGITVNNQSNKSPINKLGCLKTSSAPSSTKTVTVTLAATPPSITKGRASDQANEKNPARL
jgi:hypothetical protein